MVTKKTTAQKKPTAKREVASIASGVQKATLYNVSGAEAGTVNLPESVFAAKWNPDLVHEIVVSMMSNARANTAHTKDRSEVRGGGRKPWRQKGTGRARHGSRRSPIWRTGGVTFGPRNERNYAKKINRNARAKALASVLSKKFADGEVLFIDQYAFDAPKTSAAREAVTAFAGIKGFEALTQKKKNTALIALPARDENVERSFSNFGNMLVEQVKDINPVELLTYKYVVIANPSEALPILEARVANRARKSTAVTAAAE